MQIHSIDVDKLVRGQSLKSEQFKKTFVKYNKLAKNWQIYGWKLFRIIRWI